MVTSSFTLQALADKSGAQLDGDPHYEISSLANLSKARADQLSFLANPSYAQHLATCQAGAIILRPDMADKFAGNKLIHKDPYRAYASITGLFVRANTVVGVHPSAVVSASARIHPSASIGARAVIEDDVQVDANVVIGAATVVGAGCLIGAGTRLAANVTLYAHVTMGQDCIVHGGAVIGADGFGFAPGPEAWVKIHQLGGVRIGNKVEIGANTCIDRGALDDTIIGNDVKLDNLIQIGHNVVIGDHTAIAAHTAVAGSTRIGERCTIAGCVAVTGHIEIANGVHVSGATVVTKSITEEGSSWSSGTPMLPTGDWRRQAARFNQLDKLTKRVRDLEKQS